MTEGLGRPDWCTWWTATEWRRFRGLVQFIATRAGLAATVDDARGVLVVDRGTEGESRHSLERAAHHARDRPAEDWSAIIKESLQVGADHRARVQRLRTADLSEVRSRVKSNVFAASWASDAAGSVVTRPLGADLVEVLTLDVPEDLATVNVTPDEVRRWDLGVEALFALGRENLRTEPVRRLEPVPGIHILVADESAVMASFAASRLLLLDEEPGAAGQYGSFVVVPNHRTLAFHPIEGPECLHHREALAGLIELCRTGYDTHERLSNRLYRWIGGRVTEVQTSTVDDQLMVHMLPSWFDPDEFGAEESPASQAGERDVAEHGDADMTAYVGAHLMFAGRTEDAARLLRRAADRGHAEAMCNLGVLLAETGEAEPAERCYRQAIDLGYDGALTNLGALLDNTGRTEDAEPWFRRAAERGQPHGMHMLGRLLRRTERTGEAEQWLRRAAEDGVSGAMVDVGAPLVAAERFDEAEPWLWRAAEQGDPEGMYMLGLVLGWTNRNAEAAEWLQRAAARSHPGARAVAERWFRADAEAGGPDSMRRLGKLLADAGRVDEAERWYRSAAEAGDPEAMKEHALLLEKAGKPADAEHWYRRAIEEGSAEAMYDLGFLLKDNDRIEEAEQWYRRAAEHGVVRAMTNLGGLLHQTGRLDEAERWIRRAAEFDSTTAMCNVASIYLRRAGAHRKAGDHADADAALVDAEQWYRKAAEAGAAEAMYALGVLAQSDDVVDAQRWYRRACDEGFPAALDRLLAILDGRTPAQHRESA